MKHPLTLTLAIIAILLSSVLGVNALTGVAKIGGVAVGDVAKISTISTGDVDIIGKKNIVTTIYHSVAAYDVPGWPGQATVNVTSSINRFIALTGKSVYLQSSWLADFSGPTDFSWLLEAGDHSILPLLQSGTLKAIACSWEPYTNVDDQQTLKDIANGDYDAYLTTQANECKTFGYPIYMRLGAEFDISQGASPGDRTWATNATAFINMWTHIVDVFRTEAANNVLWVWNPNYDDFGAPNDQDDYYPGDSYVDWVGIDMYQYVDNMDPAAEMNHLCTQYSYKPIMIAEWASNSYEWTTTATSDADQSTYMTKFFNAIEAQPSIRMITHFFINYFQFGPTSGNYTGQVNTPLTTAVYQTRISDPRYITGP